jgi:predicted metal-binding membrane protein
MVTAISTKHTSETFARMNIAIASVLVTTAAVAWVSVYYLMSIGGMSVTGAMVGMFVSLDMSSLLLFLLIWIVGMVAMMFPAMISVTSIYNAAIAKSTPQSVIGSLFFLMGYLAMYLLLGVAAYLGVLLVTTVVSTLPFLWNYGTVAVGAVLVATGLWQLTPFKNACLKNCVSPLGFFLTHSRQGFGGAVRMGAEHGYYCVGCCCLYMLVMFVVAGMSLPAMALLAIMITLEKALLKGARWFNWLISAVFIILGLVVWIFPNSLKIL